MPVVICETCGTLFQKANVHGCPQCHAVHQSDIALQIARYLDKRSQVSIDELADKFEVSRHDIEKIVFQQSLDMFMSYVPVYCGMCQRKVLSKEVTRNTILCNDCHTVFKKQVDTERSSRPQAEIIGEDLCNCLLCGQEYVKRHSKLCGWCQNICMDIYRYIHRNPGITLDALAQEFQLKKCLINTMLMYGDMGTAAELVRMSCLMCETELNATNRKGKVCQECYGTLRTVIPDETASTPATARRKAGQKDRYTLQSEQDTTSLRPKQFGLKRRK